MTNGHNPTLHSVFVLEQLCVTPITTAIAPATVAAETDSSSWAASVLLMHFSPGTLLGKPPCPALGDLAKLVVSERQVIELPRALVLYRCSLL